MATATDRKRWDNLHIAYFAAKEAAQEYERELHRKYGWDDRSWRHWLKKGERDKLERLETKWDKIGDQIIDLLVRISPRGDRWLSGAPAWWLREKLTWEDAIRPADEQLSVVVPGSYGSPAGTVRERRPRVGREVRERNVEIKIPEMEWTQISGDMNPGTYGAIIARGDGRYIELVEIQPVREYVGDAEAADVGFPFWSKEAHYDLEDLDPGDKDTADAIRSMDLEQHLEEMRPEQRALAIAEALMRYGVGSEEGPGGWSKDVIFEPVKWWTGAVAGAEYLADEDESFREEILGEGEEEEEDDEDLDEEEYE